MEILYTSSSIRKKIIQIFSMEKNRRVAISAFIGYGAETYLRPTKGIEIFCWPCAGGTNPNAIRKLKQLGAKVYFSNKMHMKLYWTKRHGAIITSANISTNALGKGNLKEIGIYIPSTDIDIRKVILSLKSRPVIEEEMRLLDKMHKVYYKTNKSFRVKNKPTSFKEWYELKGMEWKLGAAESIGKKASKNSIEIAKQHFNIIKPYDFIECKKYDYKKEDWVLTFILKDKTVTNLNWLYVDYVCKSDCDTFPFAAVQAYAENHYDPPPFLIDKEFKKNFTISLFKHFIDNKSIFKNAINPGKKFLKNIYYNYGKRV